MIVRIMGEGQFEVGADVVGRLNELDEALDADLAGSAQEGFAHHIAQMVELVRSHGEPLRPDALVPSDTMIPPPDVSIEELRAMLRDDGLVPG